MIQPRTCLSAMDVEQVLQRFDHSWRNGPPPRIEDYLPANAPGHHQLLEELLPLDLEYRWRLGVKGAGLLPERPRLEDYVKKYADLGPLHRLSEELIGEEYRVRQHWGDRPGHAEYLARFPQHGAKLRDTLARIDAELAAEFLQQQKGGLVAGALHELPKHPPRAVSG